MDLGFEKVVFQLDVKTVVSDVSSLDNDVTEYGSIIDRCRDLLSSKPDFSVSFSRRLANEVAYVLAREARFQAHPTFFSDIPSCIFSLMQLMCTELHG
ncbi:hypothetical protein DITRI_Ditri16bG0032000 [Diplodiscus trichospermus]